MGFYTISISPDDGSGAMTTVSVEVDDQGLEARITELTVRAADGTGLLPQQLPSIDFALLLRAIGPASSQGAVAPSARARARVPRRATKAATKRATDAETPSAVKRRRSSRTSAKAATSTLGGRAYRRMPDDLAEVYERLQSVTDVAGHYGVPRHTAQGWMNRLRERAQA